MASSIPAEPPEAQEPDGRPPLEEIVGELGRLLASDQPADEASGSPAAQVSELLRREISERLDVLEQALGRRLGRVDRRLAALEQRQGALQESHNRLRKVIRAIGTYVRGLGKVAGDGAAAPGPTRRDPAADHLWREPG